MPFEKGNRANPGGRPKTKPWSEALQLAASREHGDKTKLHEMAAKTVEMALGGDMAAIKEVGDRLEGKAPQTVHNTNEDVTSFATLTLAELAAQTADTLRIIEEARRGDAVEADEQTEPSEVRTVN